MDRVIVGAHFEKEVLRALRGRPALPVGEQAAADPLPPPRRIDGEQQQFALRPSDAHRRKAARRLPVPRDDDTRRRQGEEGEKLRRAPRFAICRSEEHTYELQALMRNSYAAFCM